MDFKLPNSYVLEGQLISSDLNPESDVRNLKNFPFEDEDILIVGYPKCGSTWLITAIYAIIQNENLQGFKTEGPRAPRSQLEFAGSYKIMQQLLNQPKPRVLATHLQPQLLNQQVFTKNVKIIYINRNPKDVIVSFYEFSKMFPGLKTVDLPWEDYFSAFMNGQVPYGDYFEHLAEWKKYKSNKNTLFIEYEEFVKEPEKVVAKLAEYINIAVSKERVKEIVEVVSFNNMKKTQNLNVNMNLNKESDAFLRKGVIGDWKRYMNKLQNNEMSKKCEQFKVTTGINFTFE